MKLLHVVGARPNFPKLAPVHRAAEAAGASQLVVHTGQHYDDVMSGAFFRDLDIPAPDVDLAVGSGSHAVQTARIMECLEPVFTRERPDWVMVYGDVNSTMAAAIVGAKLNLRVAHVEAGLRSRDMSMPEEVNRIVTDRLACLLLTPSRDADANLRAEGEPADEIVFVGNVMIDSLIHVRSRANNYHTDLGKKGDAVVVTLHRPSNVDDPIRLAALVSALREIATERQVIFPAHPRTRQRLRSTGESLGLVRIVDPVGYSDMLDMVQAACVVITDSGGLQEETTGLGTPCITVRENTERPITITEGTNRLVPDPAMLVSAVRAVKRPTRQKLPEGWDGHAAERIVTALAAAMSI